MKSHQRNKREHGVAFEPRGGSRDWVLLSELLPTLSSLDVEWFLDSNHGASCGFETDFDDLPDPPETRHLVAGFFPARDWKIKRDDSWPRRDRQAADQIAALWVI